MIGMVIFGVGIMLGLASQLVNVLFNYDGESSVAMIVWSFLILIGFLALYVFISVVSFGGMIL